MITKEAMGFGAKWGPKQNTGGSYTPKHNFTQNVKDTPKGFSDLDFDKKTKATSDMAGTAGKGLLFALGAGILLKNVYDRIQNDTRRKALIEDLMLTDPIISKAPKDQVMSYYATINNVAPHVAVDKNVTKNLLHHFISFGTIAPDTIKMLAETNASIDKNKSLNLHQYIG